MHNSASAENIQWSSPVRLRVGYGFPENVRGPKEALDYLTWRWPVRHGHCYFDALTDCAACLQQTIPVEKVRETFILASIEAGMLS